MVLEQSTLKTLQCATDEISAAHRSPFLSPRGLGAARSRSHIPVFRRRNPPERVCTEVVRHSRTRLALYLLITHTRPSIATYVNFLRLFPCELDPPRQRTRWANLFSLMVVVWGTGIIWDQLRSHPGPPWLLTLSCQIVRLLNSSGLQSINVDSAP